MSLPPPPPTVPHALVMAHDPRAGDDLAAMIAPHLPVRCPRRIEECLTLLDEHDSVRLVCVDLDLPAYSGIGLVHAIRGNSRYADVDVIAFGGERPEVHVAAIRAGVRTCLSLPIKAGRIGALVGPLALDPLVVAA